MLLQANLRKVVRIKRQTYTKTAWQTGNHSCGKRSAWMLSPIELQMVADCLNDGRRRHLNAPEDGGEDVVGLTLSTVSLRNKDLHLDCRGPSPTRGVQHPARTH